jgi:SAF domain
VPDRVMAAVWLDARDDVATALRSIEPGERVRIRCGDEQRTIAARDAIPLGHKIALRAMEAGTRVRKYGEFIGGLTAGVAEGEWVHTHNLATAADGTARDMPDASVAGATRLEGTS